MKPETLEKSPTTGPTVWEVSRWPLVVLTGAAVLGLGLWASWLMSQHMDLMLILRRLSLPLSLPIILGLNGLENWWVRRSMRRKIAESAGFQGFDVYQFPYDPDTPVVCLDELSKQLVAEVRAPIPPAPDRAARVDYQYKRHGVANVFMFTEPLAGWRSVSVGDESGLGAGRAQVAVCAVSKGSRGPTGAR